jgi:hypothetical protein
VRASNGALYVRGIPGTHEFAKSMTELGRLRSERTAQDFIRNQTTEYARSAVDDPVEAIWRTTELTDAERVAMIGVMSEFVVASGPGTIPGYADIVRAAGLVAALDRMSPNIRRPEVDTILDAVWSRVDVGRFAKRRGSPRSESFRRISAIPRDLLERCTELTIDGSADLYATLVRAMPRLRSITVVGVGDELYEERDLRGLVAAISDLRNLDEYTIGDEVSVDSMIDSRMRVRKFSAAMPLRKPLPQTIVDLELDMSDREETVHEMAEIIGVTPSVRRLSIIDRGAEEIFGDSVAADIFSMFPNITEFSLSYDTTSTDDGAPGTDFFPGLLSRFPGLVSIRTHSASPRVVDAMAAHLADHPSSSLRELILIDDGEDSGDPPSTNPRVGGLLGRIPNVRKLGISAYSVPCIAATATTFEVLSVKNDYLSKIPAPLPLARLISIDTALPAMFRRDARPVALIPLEFEFDPASIPWVLENLVSLSVARIDSASAASKIARIVSAAPRLQYLCVQVTDDISIPLPAGTDERVSRGALTTLYIKQTGDRSDHGMRIVNLIFDSIIRRVGSPTNLVIELFGASSPETQGIHVDEPTAIRNMLRMSPNTRNLCVSGIKFGGTVSPASFYPVNVFTTSVPILFDAKVRELTWFMDVWNDGYSNV